MLNDSPTRLQSARPHDQGKDEELGDESSLINDREFAIADLIGFNCWTLFPGHVGRGD